MLQIVCPAPAGKGENGQQAAQATMITHTGTGSESRGKSYQKDSLLLPFPLRSLYLAPAFPLCQPTMDECVYKTFAPACYPCNGVSGATARVMKFLPNCSHTRIIR